MTFCCGCGVLVEIVMMTDVLLIFLLVFVHLVVSGGSRIVELRCKGFCQPKTLYRTSKTHPIWHNQYSCVSFCKIGLFALRRQMIPSVFFGPLVRIPQVICWLLLLSGEKIYIINSCHIDFIGC